MLNVPRSLMLRYAVAVLAVALALLLTFLLWPVIQPHSSLIFLAAVMFSAWYGGLGSGLLCTVLSTLAIAYFFESPVYSLAIAFADVLRLSIFVLVALLISSLNGMRQRTEETLLKREEEIRLITDAVPILISYIDSAQRYRFNNYTYEEWFGYSPREINGKHLKEVLGESAYQELEGYFEAALSGQQVTYEKTVTFKDARQRYIRSTYIPHVGEQQVKGFVALVDDITEDKRAEEALKKERDFSSAVIGTVGSLVVVLDRQGRIVGFNKACEKTTGYSFDEVTGKFLWDLFLLPEEVEPVKAVFEKLRTEALASEYENNWLTKDGRRRLIAWSNTMLFDDKGSVEYVVGTGIDITDRKQAEEALRQSEERLRLALDAAQMGTWDWNILTGQATWSKNHERLFCMAPGSFEGTYEAFLRCVHPEDREILVQALTRAISERVDYNEEFRVVWPDGSIHWMAGRGQVFYDDTDQPVRMIGTVLDITDRKQAEELLQLFALELELRVEARTAELKKANAALAAEIAERQQAQEALYNREQQFKAVVENTPDVIIRCDRQLRYVYVNPAVERNTGTAAAELISKTSEEIGAPPELCQLWNETLLKVFETGTEKTIEYQASSVEGLRIYQSRVVPEFDQDGSTQYALVVARDITEIKQAEEERAKLIREQTARLEAEAAQQRSEFLVEASTLLASSLDYETTLKSVAHLAVPYLADWCSVDLISEEGRIRRVEVAHLDPAKVELAKELHRRYPPEKNPQSVIMKVLRTGQSALVAEVPDLLLATVAQDEEYLQLLRELNPKSYMVVPLRARGRTLGVISFAIAESTHRYTAEDLALAEDLAYRAALAVDNARLYNEAQQARAAAERAAERTARLQAVTAALSEALTPSQVASVIVQQAVIALGATSAFITLLTESGTELEVLPASDYDQSFLGSWRRFSINAPVPLAEAVRTGEPIWPESTAARIARYPHMATEYKQANHNAWISIPLMLQGRAVGGMSFSFNEVRELSEDERAFTLTLAQQCAQALERARLYDAERRARAEAVREAERSAAANRTKDEFLATLSHELRTPLNAMLGWTKLLRTRKMDEATVARALETIDRNTKSLATLIEDILDVSRIITGKLRLNVRSIELFSVIEAGIDSVRSAAEAKEIQIESILDPSAGIILGDPERLQQVVWNLLSNAIKFTPKGGRVEVKLERVDQLAGWNVEGSNQPANLQPPNPCVQLRVSDTGKGINADFLPYVFDRFRQENSTTTRSYGGLGLGLAIVRHLVEMHGGTVHAESSGEGQGATFIVTLPLKVVPTQSSVPKLVSPTVGNQEPLNNSCALDGLQILVVDDEADARELLRTILKQYGAGVTAVASVGEAFEALRSLKPDLLVSDIGMPDEDGYALIRKLRAQEPEGASKLPAIALTAYAREEDRRLALEAGFHQHLSKPVEPAELLNVVAQLAGR